MADNKKIPEAEDVSAVDRSAEISSRLQAAAGNINRVSADAKARRAEQEKNKKTETDSATGSRESEKQRIAEARRAQMLEEQRLAELEYAEDYRKKLLRDKKRAEAAAREEKEAKEAAAREARAREIAEKLEKDRLEAQARGERASALLDKVVAAREAISAAESAEKETVPPAVEASPVAEEIEKAEETEKTEETVSEETEEAENADPDESSAPTEKEASDTSDGETAEGEHIITVGDEDTERMVLNITDDRILLSVSADGAVINAPSDAHLRQVSPSEALEREGTALSVKQNITVSTEDDAEDDTSEMQEIIEAVNPEYDDPITASCPEVAAIKLLGRSVVRMSEFRKYLAESRNAVKDFNKRITVFEDALNIENISQSSAASTVVEMIKALGAIVEIRCDNLRIAAKFDSRRYIPEMKKALSADIERYNGKIAEFATRTGERLTRLSPQLTERISDGTGAEIIPVFSYKERYIEMKEGGAAASVSSYTVNLPAGSEDSVIPTVVPEAEEEGCHVYTVTPVVPSVSASALLAGAHVTDRSSYRAYLKTAAKAERKIDSEVSKLRADINNAERENEMLDKRLGKRRDALARLLMNARHGESLGRGRKDKDLDALSRESEKCENIEKKMELNRAYIDGGRKNAEVEIGCLALERERLLIAMNTLSAAKAASSDKLILRAKNNLISEMARYNKLVDECSRYIDLELSPITASLADAILEGKAEISVPRIAQLRELTETVGAQTRIIGAYGEKKPRPGYTLVVNASKGESKNKTANTPIRTVHGHFFMGGVAPGNVAGASFDEADIAAAAAISMPVASAMGGADDPSAEAAAMGAAVAVAGADVPDASYAEEEGVPYSYVFEPSPQNDAIPSEQELAESSEREAPIAEAQPRMLRKTVVDDAGEKTVTEEPCPLRLIDCDEESDPSDFIIESGEPYSEPERGATPVGYDTGRNTSSYAENTAAAEETEPKKKKIRLVPLPPPEKTAEERSAEELRPVTDDGPVYPGNTINKSEYIDEDDYDTNDSTKIPSVVEVDDNAEEIENDILMKPTKRGLGKHLSYVNKKIRKAVRERRRLIAQKRKAEGVAAKARLLVNILEAQKRIIDWYCNAVTSCCDLGEMRKAKKIAGSLRSELKRYNRFVNEFEKLSGDRLTRASLDIPQLILDGEDYETLPKVKIREFEAPEDGVVYGDGVTENADYATETDGDIVMTEKDLSKRLNNSSREISKLRAKLDEKVKEKHNAWGIDKTVCTVECFGIQKKIVDTLASDLRAACQVSSVKKIQSIKRELSGEIKQYNRLVSEYKTVSGNSLTRASETIAQDIIAGNLYIPLPRVGCVYANDDDDLNRDLRAMSRNSYGVEDDSGIGGIAFRTKVTSQANKDLSLVTKRADYQISMLESERDMLSYRYGKEQGAVKRERKELGKRINQIRSAHKTALRYENSDNRRYYAVVTANPRTMELKNKRADRTRIAAIRSKIINLLNERDIVNGKLIALYTGAENSIDGSSINQKWRRIKNSAAAKSKKKQRSLADTVKYMPITVSEKTKVYNLMNEKIDAESTLALVKYRLRKEKMHKEDKLCAKRDIKELKAKIKEINKRIEEAMKALNKRISEVRAASSWYAAFIILLVAVIVALALYFYYIGPDIAALFG